MIVTAFVEQDDGSLKKVSYIFLLDKKDFASNKTGRLGKKVGLEGDGAWDGVHVYLLDPPGNVVAHVVEDSETPAGLGMVKTTLMLITKRTLHVGDAKDAPSREGKATACTVDRPGESGGAKADTDGGADALLDMIDDAFGDDDDVAPPPPAEEPPADGDADALLGMIDDAFGDDDDVSPPPPAEEPPADGDADALLGMIDDAFGDDDDVAPPPPAEEPPADGDANALLATLATTTATDGGGVAVTELEAAVAKAKADAEAELEAAVAKAKADAEAELAKAKADAEAELDAAVAKAKADAEAELEAAVAKTITQADVDAAVAKAKADAEAELEAAVAKAKADAEAELEDAVAKAKEEAAGEVAAETASAITQADVDAAVAKAKAEAKADAEADLAKAKADAEAELEAAVAKAKEEAAGEATAEAASAITQADVDAAVAKAKADAEAELEAAVAAARKEATAKAAANATPVITQADLDAAVAAAREEAVTSLAAAQGMPDTTSDRIDELERTVAAAADTIARLEAELLTARADSELASVALTAAPASPDPTKRLPSPTPIAVSADDVLVSIVDDLVAESAAVLALDAAVLAFSEAYESKAKKLKKLKKMSAAAAETPPLAAGGSASTATTAAATPFSAAIQSSASHHKSLAAASTSLLQAIEDGIRTESLHEVDQPGLASSSSITELRLGTTRRARSRSDLPPPHETAASARLIVSADSGATRLVRGDFVPDASLVTFVTSDSVELYVPLPLAMKAGLVKSEYRRRRAKLGPGIPVELPVFDLARVPASLFKGVVRYLANPRASTKRGLKLLVEMDPWAGLHAANDLRIFSLFAHTAAYLWHHYDPDAVLDFLLSSYMMDLRVETWFTLEAKLPNTLKPEGDSVFDVLWFLRSFRELHVRMPFARKRGSWRKYYVDHTPRA
ncbi:uncharacterized protein AMSG_10902 [Thecamonas trahens ATCC 50062]|uniref:Uncharacterized protein n=1 Tax=Thecamonas trahens ATCC 50062 TaxID=461836 RepID=A0A0L0DSM0_THETB|nr:hypothetical protein AMSG_10902 [Thecamonas trahens ATCC 50062]KNC55265.1 hypothetical protein AMSG_10902 [Thecamonas trahens ATCC 50062]|eukprot:XP_013753088.1 hypothetical protein AMSG_10902 [Thecamonas trahens ATCC 50062]